MVCLLIGLSQCQKPHPNCWRECDWVDYTVLVKCPLTSMEENPCTCEERDGTTTKCMDSISAYPEELTADQTYMQCQKLAGEVDSVANQYFRWEKKTDKTYCYFLPNCNNEVPSGCVPFEGAHCVAGPSGVGACDPGTTKTCIPATWNAAAIHWTCLSADRTETVSPYGDPLDSDDFIAEGITCQTVQECASWVWSPQTADNENKKKIAAVKCGENGWESVPEVYGLVDPKSDAPTDIIKPDLNDGICTCEPLELNEAYIADSSLSLICDTVFDPEEGEIEPDNTCALLCDGHFVMYIECYKGKWMNTAEYPFLEVKSEDVKC